MGTVSDGEGYLVAVQVDGDPAAALDDAVSRLEGAGFEADDSMGDAMGDNAAMLTSPDYSVVVTSADDTGDTVVTYIVSIE